METDTAVRPAGADSSVDRLAEGTELLGEYQDSAFEEPKFLVARADGQVMQLPGLLYRVLGSLDGRTAQQIAADLNAELGDELDEPLTPEDITFVVEERFRPVGLIAADGTGAEVTTAPPPLARSDPLLALRYRAGVIPASVAIRVSSVLKPLFARPVWPVLLLAFVGVDAAILLQGDVLGRATTGVGALVHQPVLLLAVLALTVVASAFHEWGHITACRYGGAAPGDVGVGIYIVWPAFYSTVTDSYRLDRRGRLRTDLGGVYFDAILLAVLGLVYLRTGQQWLLIALVGLHAETAWQFLPSVRLDGYYILADLIGVPDLFGYVKATLVSLIPGRPTHPKITELKPRARRLVVAWVGLVVPVLAAGAAAFVLAAPAVLPAAVRGAGEYLHQLSAEARTGDVVATTVGVLQLTLSLLPWVGSLLLLFAMARKVMFWAVARLRLDAKASEGLRRVGRLIARLVVLAGIGAALLWRVAQVASSHPAGGAEAGLIDNAVAAVRGGHGVPSPGVGELLVRQQLIWYAKVTDAFGRSASVVLAARELAVVLTGVLVAALLVLVLTRRVRPLAAGLSLVALLAMGPAVTVLATIGPGVVGVAWTAAGATLLACTRGRVTATVGGVMMAIGVATEPSLAVALAVGVGVLLGRGTSPRRHAAVAASKHAAPDGGAMDPRRWLPALLVLPAAGLVVVGTGSGDPGPLAWPDHAVLLLWAALIVVTGLVVRRVRPLAASAGAAAVLAVLPWAADASALPAVVASGALVLAILVDTVIRTPTPHRAHPLVRAAFTVPLLVLTIVGGLFLPTKASPAPDRQLAAWITGPSSGGGAVGVPSGLWGQLVRDGVPADRLKLLGTAAANDVPWAVGRPSSTVADRPISFGRGTSALSVVPTGKARAEAQVEHSAALAPAQQQRVDTSPQTLGALLAGNQRLSGPPDVMATVAQGKLDDRALTALAGLVAGHSVSLGASPAAGAPGDALARSLLITALDGQSAARPSVRASLTDLLHGLGAVTAGTRITAVPSGLAVAWG